MKLNVIDLTQRLELEYNIKAKIDLFKDYGTYQYLYTVNKYTLIIFKYDLSIDKISIEYIININNKNMTFLEILDIDEKKNQVIYVIYDSENMSVLKFSRIGEIEETIVKGNYENSILLNERYCILVNSNNLYYLLDIYTCELYIIKELEKYGLNIEETRLLIKEDQEYIIFIKSFLDEYDCYMDYKEKKYIQESGIYYSKFDNFIKEIKEKNNCKIKPIIEAKKDSYIFKIYYDFSKENLEHIINYQYYIIDYKKQVLYLYNIVSKDDKLDSFLLDKIDISDFNDCYNLFVDGPKINVYKLNSRYIKNQYKNIYPEKYIVEYYDRERFIKSLNGYNIFTFWNEDEKTGEYISGIRIRNKNENDLFMEIVGDGIILDNGSILILDKIRLKTYSSKLESPKEDFFSIMNNLEFGSLDYIWLISDLELKNNSKNIYKYKFFTYNEIIQILNSINKDIMNIRIMGFSKEYSKESIKNNLHNLENIEDYFNNKGKLMHPASLIEISYNKKMIILVTDERSLYNEFREKYKNSTDLEEYIKIKDEILLDICRVLENNNLNKSYSMAIFEKFYSHRVDSLDGYIQDEEILQHYKKLVGI